VHPLAAAYNGEPTKALRTAADQGAGNKPRAADKN
jgi:hypothetical protein